MKKVIALGLSLSLMVPSGLNAGADLFHEPYSDPYAHAAQADFEGYGELFSLMAMALLAVGIAAIVGISKGVQALKFRSGAKKAGVSVAIYRVAQDLLDNKDFKELLKLADQKKSAELKKKIVQLNKQYFGDDWENIRKNVLNDYTDESKDAFIQRYSKELYDKVGPYIKLYAALAKLHGGNTLKCESRVYIASDSVLERVQRADIKEYKPSALEVLTGVFLVKGLVHLVKTLTTPLQNSTQSLVLIRGLDRKLGWPEQIMPGHGCQKGSEGSLSQRKQDVLQGFAQRLLAGKV